MSDREEKKIANAFGWKDQIVKLIKSNLIIQMICVCQNFGLAFGRNPKR
jgi:hypothetical protein